MARRRLDQIPGSWPLLTALACLAAILLLGLGSERVRRAVREKLPVSLGGVVPPPAFNPEDIVREEKTEAPKEVDPNALPDVPKEESLRGIVKDAAGKPIPGATVTAERWRESRWESLATARTNKDGEFVLGPVPKAQLSACARAEGYASDRKTAKTGARLEFVLKKGGNLDLKVVDAVTGDPVIDCYLSGWSGSGDWYEASRTGKDGKCRFASVPPGRIWLNLDVCQCGSMKMPPSVVAHEVGHALGFYHVSDRESVMLPYHKGGCRPAELSSRERYHAPLAYRRTSGHTAPDTDTDAMPLSVGRRREVIN